MGAEDRRRPISGATVRELRAHFPAGVMIVTSRLGPELHGVTVTAFCFASLHPPLAVICLERPSRSVDVIGQSGVFAVHAPSWQQMFLADRFAGRGPRVDIRFSDVPHRLGVTGSPILDGAIAWLDCRVTETRPIGDHTLFVGQIVDGAAGVGDESAADGDAFDESPSVKPLVYFQRRYLRLDE